MSEMKKNQVLKESRLKRMNQFESVRRILPIPSCDVLSTHAQFFFDAMKE